MPGRSKSSCSICRKYVALNEIDVGARITSRPRLPRTRMKSAGVSVCAADGPDDTTAPTTKAQRSRDLVLRAHLHIREASFARQPMFAEEKPGRSRASG